RSRDGECGSPHGERQRNYSGEVRVSNALRDPARSAAQAGGGWIPAAAVRTVRRRLVSVFHAAACGASGERDVLDEKFISEVTAGALRQRPARNPSAGSGVQ